MKPRARGTWAANVRGLAAGVTLAAIAAVSATASVGAQSAKDSALYVQAQEMVANGAAANGRKLADSVANAATPGSAAYAEGLFWRATLAANAQDSEHEYRQIIVDYPLSGRVAAALLRIGQLEAARGENAAALQHFQRLVLEHPLSPLRAEGSYWVARMYFEANDPSHGCAANANALASVSTGNVELKNRIDFQQQRCRGVVLAADDNATPATTPTRISGAEAAVASKASKRKPAEKIAEKSVEKPVEKLAEKPKSKASDASVRAEKTAKVTTETPTKAEANSVAKTATEVPPSAGATVSGNSTASSASSSTSGAANRQPTQEEVARALASARLKVSSTAAASIERKSNASKSSAKAESTKHDSAASEAKAPAKSASAAGSKAASKSAAGQYAVQVAAFGSKSAAVVLVNKLHGRGYDTYIDGLSAPYRVRIGHYSSHAGAAAELAKLKAKHIDGFVVER